VATEGFEEGSELPIRLILYDLSTGQPTREDLDPIKVVYPLDCGCADWVLIPKRAHRYKIEIQIFSPGEIEGSPEEVAYSPEFTAA